MPAAAFGCQANAIVSLAAGHGRPGRAPGRRRTRPSDRAVIAKAPVGGTGLSARSRAAEKVAWMPGRRRSCAGQRSSGRRSDAYAVMEVNNTAPETALGQELEFGTNVVWQCALSATHDDRREEQVALVD